MLGELKPKGPKGPKGRVQNWVQRLVPHLMRVRLLAFGLVVSASAAAGFSMPGVVGRVGMGSVKMQETTSPVCPQHCNLDGSKIVRQV